MTSITETIAKMVEQQDERLRLALERGGLPTDEEATAVYNGLVHEFGIVEQLTWRVEGIALADVGDLPFAVTAEQLGILAVLTDDVERLAEDLREQTKKLRHAFSSLASLREGLSPPAKR
jgi:hypothetical protein